jgi:hypothetical protein
LSLGVARGTPLDAHDVNSPPDTQLPYARFRITSSMIPYSFPWSAVMM